MKPLAGKSIVVTRTRQQASRLSRELTALGAHVIEIPAIEIVPPKSYEPLDAALRQLQQYQWLIVTSANTVRVLAERMQKLAIAPSQVFNVHVAAIGSATSTALREAGFSVDLVPAEYVAESVAESLCEKVAGAKILLVRAAVARDVIPERLRQCGAHVEVVDAYRTILPAQSKAQMQIVFDPNAELPDAVAFTSSSTVTNFLQMLHDCGISLPAQSLQAISIGPITSETLRKNGWEPAAEADPHDIDGLVAAVVRALR
ncbi:MAG TPA: uroporphyrinogen-III synthase [Alloacidobacterium sp.]|nr:uroporphyrinogen-III synthase [Alloacidobacterium sp.]